MKTKIVVLHLKEVLFTTLFAILGILLIAMIIILFLPNKESSKVSSDRKTQSVQSYQSGKYSAPVTLGNQTLHIQVTIEDNTIRDICFLDLSSEAKTMYPLLIPSLDDLSKQIIASQSLEEIVYPDERKYTSVLLINAIKEALQQATES